MIKDINMDDPENYANMIKKGDPDFIEVKAYMFVGMSRQRLEKSNMPFHEDVVEFSKLLNDHLSDYEIVSEHIPSRVIMFAKKKFKVQGTWKTWIDFKKYDQLVTNSNDFTTDDYLKEIPKNLLGISGKGTEKNGFQIDEKTKETEFWKQEVSY
tara:strand:+ start:91 stop:552 length:462 start_codon:yes stop_codon:yes gene_type:complete